MKSRALRRWLALGLAMCLGISGAPETARVQAQATAVHSGASEEQAGEPADTSYRAYCARYASAPHAQATISVDMRAFRSPTGNASWAEGLEGNPSAGVQTQADGAVEWDFTVQQTGLYAIRITYLPVLDKGSTITRSLMLDGRTPFDEAATLNFARVFENAEKMFDTDVNGNQIRPTQVEVPCWQSVWLRDSLGYETEPLLFYLEAGTHTLCLSSLKEAMIVGAIELGPPPAVPSEEEKSAAYRQAGYVQADGKKLRLQGEEAVRKSDNKMYPVSDTSSPATDPSSSTISLLNTIGGSKWQTTGQWLEWDFDIAQAGLYRLDFRVRQNVAPGQPVYRRILIDGEVPSQAYADFKTGYDTQWQMLTPGGEAAPSLVYLSEGPHTLRMEVHLGELADLARRVDESMRILNEIYLSFLMVIGPSADKNRDYDFAELFPEEIEEMGRQSAVFRALAEEYIAINGEEGSQSQQLQSLAQQLEKMNRRPDKIAKLFGDFLNNISALGTWLSSAAQQPLEIDYIDIVPPRQTADRAEAGFWEGLVFSVRRFIASFFTDYESIGLSQAREEAVTVWTFSGRDQANALNQLIQNDFTAETNIPVNLQLVPVGTLLTATLAGKGPDVALSNGQSDPLNYAIRGAVQDLRQFHDYEEVAARFQPSALVPLEFDGHAYGLPETQNFPVMIYRSDIMEQLNLEIPETWEDVIALLPELQKRNLTFGLQQPYVVNSTGAGLGVFATFLYQQGGDFYSEDGARSRLDEKEAIDAFSQWVNFYNQYSLPTQYDFNSRFRTGEIPIGIADYGVYNALSVFAPELSGVCRFALVPGVRREDGTVDHTVSSSVTATVLMTAAKAPEDCWAFMKWWTSAEVQDRYGNEIESIMGTAGRYQTANKEALQKIPWTTADLQVLLEQWEWTRGIPEVPGSYMTPRYLDFAFKQAYRDTSATSSLLINDPGEILINATRLINIELDEKRREFGLQ